MIRLAAPLLLAFLAAFSLVGGEPEGGVIEVEVVSIWDEAVVGAKVTLGSGEWGYLGGEEWGHEQLVEALTDGQGRTSLGPLPPGTYHLKVEANWFAPVEQPGFVVADDVQTIRFTLSEAIICLIGGGHDKPHEAQVEIGVPSALLVFSAYERADKATIEHRADLQNRLRACLAEREIEVRAEVSDVFDARIGRQSRKLLPWRHAASGNGVYLTRPGKSTEIFTCVGGLDALAIALPVYAARFFGVESCSPDEPVKRWPECYRMSVSRPGVYEPLDLGEEAEPYAAAPRPDRSPTHRSRAGDAPRRPTAGAPPVTSL